MKQMRGDPPTDDRVVKRMSSCLLHPSHKLTCSHPILQLETPEMFRLGFHNNQHHPNFRQQNQHDVIVSELACASTSSSVAKALQEEQFQVGVESGGEEFEHLSEVSEVKSFWVSGG